MTTDKETPYWEQDIAECLRVAAEIIGPNSYYLRAAEYIEEMRDQIVMRNVRIAVLEKNEITLKNLLGACRCHIDNPSFDEEGDLTQSVDEVLKL